MDWNEYSGFVELRSRTTLFWSVVYARARSGVVGFYTDETENEVKSSLVLDNSCDVRACTEQGDRQFVFKITRESRGFLEKASGERDSWFVSVSDSAALEMWMIVLIQGINGAIRPSENFDGRASMNYHAGQTMTHAIREDIVSLTPAEAAAAESSTSSGASLLAPLNQEESEISSSSQTAAEAEVERESERESFQAADTMHMADICGPLLKQGRYSLGHKIGGFVGSAAKAPIRLAKGIRTLDGPSESVSSQPLISAGGPLKQGTEWKEL